MSGRVGEPLPVTPQLKVDKLPIHRGISSPTLVQAACLCKLEACLNYLRGFDSILLTVAIKGLKMRALEPAKNLLSSNAQLILFWILDWENSFSARIRSAE
jgi:hypothetical protein